MSSGLFVGLDRQDLTSAVLTALLADAMRQAGCAASRADALLNAFVTIGRVTNSDLALADFTLLNSHDSLTPIG